MPAMIFPARCPACDKDVKFIEFKAEPCTPGPDSPAAEYGFRCMACKARQPELVDATGKRHRWVAGKHVEA